MIWVDKEQVGLADGVICLDKPTGITSNRALQKVKRFFGVKKAGHVGCLDPLASGLLPICLGQATKYSRFLIDESKQYHVEVEFGIKTDTQDKEGQIIHQCANFHLSESEVLHALEGFKGDIQQVPPMYSALKHQGKPLYAFARKGVEIPRAARQVTIYSLSLESFEPYQDRWRCQLDVMCSKGTYIRSLVEDLGDQLGCGACVSQLRRVVVGPFQLTHCLSFEQMDLGADPRLIQAQHLIKIGDCLTNLRKIALDPLMATRLYSGLAIEVPVDLNPQEWVTFELEGDFLGVGQGVALHHVVPKRMQIRQPFEEKLLFHSKAIA